MQKHRQSYHFLIVSMLMIFSMAFIGKSIVNFHLHDKTHIECQSNETEEDCNEYESFEDLIDTADLLYELNIDFVYQKSPLPSYENFYRFLAEKSKFNPPKI